MEVRCYNKKCLYEWSYRGKSKDYITCPKCHYRIKLNKALTHYPILMSKTPLKSTHSLTHSLKKKNIKDSPLIKIKPKPKPVTSQEEYDEIKIYDEFTGQLQETIKYKKLGEKATIKILSSFLPASIQKALDEKKQEQNNPFLNPLKEKPNFEIKIIPRNPIKILEHQKSFM